MRIMVLTNEFEPNVIGGLGIVATRLSSQLAASGHHVTVLTKGRSHKVMDRLEGDLRVIRFPRDSIYHSATAQQFRSQPVLEYIFPRLRPPDIIHIHSIQMDQVNTALQAFRDSRAVYTCHSLIAFEGIRSPRVQSMHQRQLDLLAKVDAVVSPSRWQARVLDRAFGNMIKASYVVPNGASVGRLHSRGNVHDIVFIGRLVRAKGVEELIQAIKVLKREYPVHLDIVGHGEAGYVRKLQGLVRSLDLTRRVRFLGHMDHERVLQRIPTYGAVVVPSKNESFGLVALEAMASGTPLVATRIGGLRDFVDDHVASIIRAPQATAIAQAIAAVWNLPQGTEQLRLAAHLRAQAYGWIAVAQLYEKVMDGTADPFSAKK